MKAKMLTCIQCENQFILSTAEYERLHYRGFSIPRRCPDCRKRKSKNILEINVDWAHKRRKRHGRGSEKHFEAGEF